MMPNIKSAEKRVKVTAVKNARNKARRSELKTAIKKAELALTGDSTDKNAVVRQAMKEIDIAVTKGILHKNSAARKKSSLALKLNHAG